MRVLLLGGTREAAELAHALQATGAEVETSLAGRTKEPKSTAGTVRIGGFGGTQGLEDYLRRKGFDVAIDATHPFAERISLNLERACSDAGLPRLVLYRPPWERRAGDRWIEVPDLTAAAEAISPGRTALLALGRQHVAALAWRSDVRFVVRSIEPVEDDTLHSATFVQARPSASAQDEAVFMTEQGIDVVVSRNSGGPGAYAKIEAARQLNLPVIVIDRPRPPSGPRVSTVREAIQWVRGVNR